MPIRQTQYYILRTFNLTGERLSEPIYRLGRRLASESLGRQD
jgi:hypothetical protein